jgi:hypothetical protein
MTTFEKLYIAVEKFDPSSGDSWDKYIAWSGLHQLVEVFGLDGMLNPPLLVLKDAYWDHIVNEDYMLDYFTSLDFLLSEVDGTENLNIVGCVRSPSFDMSNMKWEGFSFLGYELLDQENAISALTNCGGFPDVFRNDELSDRGLVKSFDRAAEIRRDLKQFHPEEHHADCNIWAIFRWHGLAPAAPRRL